MKLETHIIAGLPALCSRVDVHDPIASQSSVIDATSASQIDCIEQPSLAELSSAADESELVDRVLSRPASVRGCTTTVLCATEALHARLCCVSCFSPARKSEHEKARQEIKLHKPTHRSSSRSGR